jgi:prepilin-type processing-associated H-X9-DG protein
MQYTLRHLLLVFVLLAAALGVFGAWGALVAAVLLAIVVAAAKERPLIYLALSFALLLGLFAAVGSTENAEDSRRCACANNLRQVALGLLNYDADNGDFPPAYVVSADGVPAYSWRLMLLPSLDRSDVSDRFHRDELWNSASNKECVGTAFHVFKCSHVPNPYSSNLTSFVAVTGPQTAWPGTKATGLRDIPDGSDNTILIMELTDSDIAWAEPRDLTFEQVGKTIAEDPQLKMFAAHETQRGFLCLPEKGANVAFADGSVRFLTTGFLQKYLKAMLTRDGGEKVDFEDMPPPNLNWPRIIGLAVLVFSMACLLRPQIRKSFAGPRVSA